MINTSEKLDQNTQPPPRSGRGNRQQDVLDSAASLFRSNGFDGTSLRDIAGASGMLPGSIYFHFRSKEDIFLAVQKQGIQHLTEAILIAVKGITEPWARLEAACAAHMNVILNESDFAAVLVNVTPTRSMEVWEQLAGLRDEYEKNFRQLVDDLPLPPGTNRKYLRLALLGSMNWAHSWYRAGRDKPEQLAIEIVWLYRCGLQPE